MNTSLHIGGAIAASLKRVYAHHLHLGQPKRQRLSRIAPLELALGNARGHEAVVLL